MLEPKEDIHVIPESSKYSSSVLGWNEVKVTQLCPTLCDPMDYTRPEYWNG